MRRFLFLAVCVPFLAVTAPPAMSPARAQTMRITLPDDPDALDPALSRTLSGRNVFAALCDKLFDIDEKLDIVPQLATSHEWTDPKTLILHLREGVLFQDGEPFDAAAVKYTLERDLTLQGSYRRAEIGAIDHIDVVDTHTVRIVLKQPSAPFLAQLTDRSGMIVAPKAAEAAGKDFGLHPVCAGPFKFVERVPQDHITLERFPDYWNKSAIHLDRVVYRPIPDGSIRLANLQAGSTDIDNYVVPTDAATVQGNKALKLVLYDGLGYYGLTFNVANGAKAQGPIGHDPRVRKAFELAIDRDALLQVVYNGMFPATAQGVPHVSPFYVPSIKPPARDVARAKALLQEAGVKLPVPVALMAANAPDQVQAATVIQSMASEAGFDVHVNAVEFGTMLAAAQRGDFEAYLIGWSGRIDADGNYWSFLHTDGPLNDGHYSNADVDGLLDQARRVSDVAERRDLYGRMLQQVTQDDPIVYLWIQRNIMGMSAKVQGYRMIPDGLMRLQGVSLAK